MDPDHDAILANATWSLERTQRFNAADDPILYAREWLEGYEFRLQEADRARHYPNATPETYARALEWADDPKRDRCYEAIALLLERINKHPQPPYSPEVLKLEHDRLWDIPLHARLRNGFAERFRAWIDRAETFLSMGGGGNAGAKPPALPAGAEAIDEHDAAILAFLNRTPSLRRKVSDVLPDTGPGDRKAIGKRLRKLADRTPPLVDYPKGKHGKVAILPAGIEMLKRATAPKPQ